MVNVLIGLTGHPSARERCELQSALPPAWRVRTIVTGECRPHLGGAVPANAVDDATEWYAWKKVGDEVLHIELTRWADCLVVSPLSANYLAKLAHGLCDDLLTSVARAWSPAKPVLLEPAMPGAMWDHALTREHFAALHALRHVHVLGADGAAVPVADFCVSASAGEPGTLSLLARALGTFAVTPPCA